MGGLNSGLMRPVRLLRRALICSLIVLQAPSAGAQSQQPAPPREGTIRVSVDRVNVGVIVTDAQGRFIEGLRRDDFQVFDNLAQQPLTEFAAVEEPAQVLLLIEAGPAVYLLEGGHLQAAYSLLNGLSAGDRVAVVKYADVPATIMDFTADKLAAENALGELRFNLGFGSLNLSSSLSTVLDWLTKVKGKKTVVLLSTGVDTSPSNDWRVLLQQLKTSDVRILAVSLMGELKNPQPNRKKKTTASNSPSASLQFEEADQLLKGIAEATGGRAYFPKSAKEFSAAYAEIAQLVRHEYSLAFVPAAHDGKIHSIEVRIGSLGGANASTANFRANHRQAYLAPPPDAQ